MFSPFIKRVMMILATSLMISTAAYSFDLKDLSQTIYLPPISSGNFIQERELSGFPKPLRSEGIYFLDIQKGIIWETKKPFPNTLIFSGQGIKTLNAHSTEAISTKDIPYLKTINTLMLSVFSAKLETLKKHFYIELRGSANDWTMRLVPLNGSSLSRVLFSIEISGSKTPKTIKIINHQNEKTTLNLFSQKRLEAWPEGLDPL